MKVKYIREESKRGSKCSVLNEIISINFSRIMINFLDSIPSKTEDVLLMKSVEYP